jgi:DNA-binding transcriptional ArsR family regulator
MLILYLFYSSNIFELFNGITFLCYHAIMRTLFHPNRSDIQLTAILYALSDPIRLNIVRNLADSKELTCGAFDISIAKSTLSHHFKVLRESGVIEIRLEGRQRLISLRTTDLDNRFPGLLESIQTATKPF